MKTDLQGLSVALHKLAASPSASMRVTMAVNALHPLARAIREETFPLATPQTAKLAELVEAVQGIGWRRGELDPPMPQFETEFVSLTRPKGLNGNDWYEQVWQKAQERVQPYYDQCVEIGGGGCPAYAFLREERLFAMLEVIKPGSSHEAATVLNGLSAHIDAALPVLPWLHKVAPSEFKRSGWKVLDLSQLFFYLPQKLCKTALWGEDGDFYWLLKLTRLLPHTVTLGIANDGKLLVAVK